MRVALFGGSFDPIHCGHIEPVLEVVRVADLDRVIYCPTARPPHKRDRDLAPALRRYAMVEAALKPWQELRVSTYELREEAKSFTLDTVRHYLETQPEWSLSLLLGADAWEEIDTYRAWQEILDLVPVIVMSRPGSILVPRAADEGRPAVQALMERGRVTFVRGPGVDVSSRELRRILTAGDDPPPGWLPDPVLELIRQDRLYR